MHVSRLSSLIWLPASRPRPSIIHDLVAFLYVVAHTSPCIAPPLPAALLPRRRRRPPPSSPCALRTPLPPFSPLLTRRFLCSFAAAVRSSARRCLDGQPARSSLSSGPHRRRSIGRSQGYLPFMGNPLYAACALRTWNVSAPPPGLARDGQPRAHPAVAGAHPSIRCLPFLPFPRCPSFHTRPRVLVSVEVDVIIDTLSRLGCPHHDSILLLLRARFTYASSRLVLYPIPLPIHPLGVAAASLPFVPLASPPPPSALLLCFVRHPSPILFPHDHDPAMGPPRRRISQPPARSLSPSLRAPPHPLTSLHPSIPTSSPLHIPMYMRALGCWHATRSVVYI